MTHGDVTVEDFINLRDRVMGDTLAGIARRHRVSKVKESKVKREHSSPALAYQVRNITAGVWGFYFPNVEENHKFPVSHWLGDNGYEAIDRNAGLKFDSAGKAKQFRANGFRHKH